MIDALNKHAAIVLLSVALTLFECVGSEDAFLKSSQSSTAPCVGGSSGLGCDAELRALASSDSSFTFVAESEKFDDLALMAKAEEVDGAAQHLTMDLKNTKVGDTGVQALAWKLPGGLRSLVVDLSGTDVSDLGVEALARELPGSLQSLHLDAFRTSMSDRGLEALSKELPTSLQALSLGLRYNHVGDHGLLALRNGLPQRLRTLDINLYSTDVHNLGLENFAKGLPSSLQSLTLNVAYTSVDGVGIAGFAKGLPGGLQSLNLCAWVTRVSDVGLEAVAKNLPSTLQHLHVDLSFSKVTDKGVQALAAYSGPHLNSIHVDFHATTVGDRGLHALCAMKVMHRKGDKIIRLGATFVSSPEAKACEAKAPDVDLVYDMSETPWPKAIDDLIYGDGGVTRAVPFLGRCDGGACTLNQTFDCLEQDWILERNAVGRTAYHKASARHGRESPLAKCLKKAGGDPSLEQHFVHTFTCAWTWLTIFAATCCGLVLARVRIRANSLATGQLRSGICIPVWLRTIEVAAQCVMFFGPVALALKKPISVVIFLACVALPACEQHGLNSVLKYPVLVFASRTPRGFAISGLRSALLACIAWGFTTHASMHCERSSHLADTQDIQIESRLHVQDFVDIDVLGIFTINHEIWEYTANPFLARIEYNRSWETETVTVPLPSLHSPSFDVDLKMMFDAWVHLFIGVGCLWTCIVSVLLVLHFAGPRPAPSSEQAHELVQSPDGKAEGDGLLDRATDAVKRLSKAKLVAFFLLDFATDANTIFAMMFSDHFKFAFVLMTVWIAEVFEEYMYGAFLNVWEETEKTLRTGQLSKRVQGIVTREASFDTCISAAVTAYAFPFVVTSLYEMLSLTFSLFMACLTMAGFLYHHLDLEEGSAEDSEDSEVDVE